MAFVSIPLKCPAWLTFRHSTRGYARQLEINLGNFFMILVLDAIILLAFPLEIFSGFSVAT